jgi:hypothetical protein
VNKKSIDYKVEISKIFDYVREFYLLEKGFIIPDLYSGIIVGHVFISRKSIKHIVERRKDEGKSLEDISVIFERIPKVIRCPEFIVKNDSSNYPNSIAQGVFFGELNRGIVVILSDFIQEKRHLVTVYTKKSRDYKSFFKVEK